MTAFKPLFNHSKRQSMATPNSELEAVVGTPQCEKHISPQQISVMESTRSDAQILETLNLCIGQPDVRVSKTAPSSPHSMNATEWIVQEVKKLPRSTLEDKDGWTHKHITLLVEPSMTTTRRNIIQHLIPKQPTLTGWPPKTTHPQTPGSFMILNFPTKHNNKKREGEPEAVEEHTIYRSSMIRIMLEEYNHENHGHTNFNCPKQGSWTDVSPLEQTSLATKEAMRGLLYHETYYL